MIFDAALTRQDLLALDSQVPHSAVEMAAVDSHFFGSFGYIPVVLGELVKYELTLIRVGRRLE